MTEALLQVFAPHFCAGLILENTPAGWVVGSQVAPILAYTKGWGANQLKAYLVRKGWQWLKIPDII